MEDAARQLDHFLHLWFDLETGGTEDPAAKVRPVLRFNHPVTETVDGDVEVLVVEQQGVWLWGRTADERFVERENEPGVPWRDTEEDEHEFWLHHAAFEASHSQPASRSAQLFEAPTVARITDVSTPLPCGAWTWPGTKQRMYARGAAVVMVCEDGDDFWVVASAPTEADLGWLDHLDLTWDESDSRRDPGA